MTPDQHEVLNRFHRTLVRELRSMYSWDLGAPLTVAEIYRDLVPYPTRGEGLGVETHADYGLVLLRLLAGEGDYVTIESQTVGTKIRAELESPSPDTGLYRDYAGVEVRLNVQKAEEAISD